MKICEKVCTSLLTKSKLPDADYVINPYVGCCHGCIYCYAQFMKRFSGHANEAWGSFMDVKTGWNIPKKDFSGQTILLGSVTDPYNQLERKYLTTRKILETLVAKKIPANFEILTKSPLILRDMDLLKQLPNIRVGISLSTTDPIFARRTEKHAASPAERINTIHTLFDNGIPVYAFVSPIFPYLSDWRQVIDALGDKVNQICFENLNLRANYRTDVFNMVKEFYPDTFYKFTALYENPTQLHNYWENEAREIENYLGDKPHKLYFFHEEIRKD